jgi:hypothetical protein
MRNSRKWASRRQSALLVSLAILVIVPLSVQIRTTMISNDDVVFAPLLIKATPMMYHKYKYHNSSVHPLTELLQDNRTIFLLELRPGIAHGLGSTVLWMLVISMYFQDTQNRQLVVDQTQTTSYRWNETHGMFTSFFYTPNIPIIDDATNEYKRVEREVKEGRRLLLLGPETNVWTTPATSAWKWTDPKWISDNSSYISDNTSFDAPVLKVAQAAIRRYADLRSIALAYYGFNQTTASAAAGLTNNDDNVHFFERLSISLCENIKISAQSQQHVQTTLSSSMIPDFVTTSKEITTAAFHIRRGDKLIHESPKFLAEEYVKKLQEALPDPAHWKRIQHCFVATDDLKAVRELQVVLTEMALPCQLHTLKTSGKSSKRDKETTLLFLAEMKMLIDGMYESNERID